MLGFCNKRTCPAAPNTLAPAATARTRLITEACCITREREQAAPAQHTVMPHTCSQILYRGKPGSAWQLRCAQINEAVCTTSGALRSCQALANARRWQSCQASRVLLGVRTLIKQPGAAMLAARGKSLACEVSWWSAEVLLPMAWSTPGTEIVQSGEGRPDVAGRMLFGQRQRLLPVKCQGA